MVKKSITKKNIFKFLDKHTKRIAPKTFPLFEKCMRSHCSKEYSEYEEKIPKNITKIQKCMNNKSRSIQNDRCLHGVLSPLMRSLSKCSNINCHIEEGIFKKEMKKTQHKYKY
jgi:hypothetical protein